MDKKGVKNDDQKNRLELVPPSLVLAVGRVLTYGAVKYAPENWRLVDNGIQRYRGALLRHLMAYLAGNLVDDESGLPHLWHVAANAAFLIELEACEKNGGDCIGVDMSAEEV